ncbi:MAG TPA: lasso peptide biosynthesis B2 protein [Pyrinomonadaceae bacterium]|jgi:hypothetical protein|nr:lasso peptide biosynthesis B2 protein [Pyrinomonadaceae bacterium]
MGSFSKQFLDASKAARRAARFTLRDPGSAFLMLRMGAWVATLTLLMKLAPLPRVMQLITPLRRRTPRPARPGEVSAELARLLDLLLSSDVWIFTPTCWKRAPVLYRYLALRGIETRVVFGVRKDSQGALDGHAWLEADGEPVLERAPPDYKLTFSFPS